MASVDVVLPRSPERRRVFAEHLRALTDAAMVEVFHAFEVWGETVDDGRRVVGVLNRRYDLCVLEVASPAPWIAAAYDGARGELVLAAFLTDRRAISCEACAELCAQALAERIEQLDCY